MKFIYSISYCRAKSNWVKCWTWVCHGPDIKLFDPLYHFSFLSSNLKNRTKSYIFLA